MTQGETLVCAWCHNQFSRPHAAGPTPKYCSAKHRQAAHFAREGLNVDFAPAVLRVFQDADLHGDLLWRVSGHKVGFSAICSDTFWWATADAEEITLDDLPLLRQCLEDLRPFDEEHHLCALYAARRRGMRPMRAWLKQEVENSPAKVLFLAAGPERDPKDEL